MFQLFSTVPGFHTHKAPSYNLESLKLIHNVTEPTTAPKDIFDKYPECFKGVAKLKSFQLEIPIDPEVEPVIQPLRHSWNWMSNPLLTGVRDSHAYAESYVYT
jgi:hypothetical protein